MCQQVALHSFIQARSLLDKSQRSFRSLQAASSPFLVLLSLKSRDLSHPLAATVSFLEYSSRLPLSDLLRLAPSSAVSGTLNSLPSGRVLFIHSLSNAASDVDATVEALQAVASEVVGDASSQQAPRSVKGVSGCQSVSPSAAREVGSATQSGYPSAQSGYPSAHSAYQPTQSAYPSTRSPYVSAQSTNHYTTQSPTISTQSPTISTQSPTVTRLPCGPTLTHTLKAVVRPETLDWRRLPLCSHCMNHCDTIESAVRDTVVAVGSPNHAHA